MPPKNEKLALCSSCAEMNSTECYWVTQAQTLMSLYHVTAGQLKKCEQLLRFSKLNPLLDPITQKALEDLLGIAAQRALPVSPVRTSTAAEIEEKSQPLQPLAKNGSNGVSHNPEPKSAPKAPDLEFRKIRRKPLSEEEIIEYLEEHDVAEKFHELACVVLLCPRNEAWENLTLYFRELQAMQILLENYDALKEITSERSEITTKTKVREFLLKKYNGSFSLFIALQAAISPQESKHMLTAGLTFQEKATLGFVLLQCFLEKYYQMTLDTYLERNAALFPLREPWLENSATKPKA